MRSSLKILAGILAVVAIVAVAQAKSITYRGQTFDVQVLSEDGPLGSSTVVKDLSVRPTQSDRRGLYVATYAFGVNGGVTVDISSEDIPKGVICLEDAVIEVYEAIAPATSTNSLSVGGVTLLATGTTLNSTGIKAAVATAAQTTSADKIALTVTGDAATAGIFTIYLPVILGNDQ